MPEPRRNVRPWLLPEDAPSQETTRAPKSTGRFVRDTQPDAPPRRPARPAPKSGMRPRRARGGVTEVDASSHHKDPRREK